MEYIASCVLKVIVCAATKQYWLLFVVIFKLSINNIPLVDNFYALCIAYINIINASSINWCIVIWWIDAEYVFTIYYIKYWLYEVRKNVAKGIGIIYESRRNDIR